MNNKNNKLSRKDKENYLIETCAKHGFREDTPEFRKGVAKISDTALEIKLESLKMILEN